MTAPARHVFMRAGELECALSLVTKEQRAPRNRRMTGNALRFASLHKLPEMSVFVTRLTFRQRPLVFSALHTRCDLLLMAIRTSNRKMFSNQRKLGREMVKTN